MNKIIDVTIINTMPFPSGAASVNRIISYAKGLVELGNKVSVFTTSYGKDREQHEFKGIKYRALRIKSNSRVRNLFSLPIALLKLIRIVFSMDKKTALILVTDSRLLIYPIYFITRLKGIKLTYEVSEYPFILIKKSFLGKLFAPITINLTYKLFDAMIIMTHKLEEFYKNKSRKDCKTIVVPMTVEPERFDVKSENAFGDYIAYCGDIGGNKDGVQNLIHAFSLVKSDFPNLKLILIGGSKNPDDKLKLESYIEKIKCKDIIFYGMVSRNDIPYLLNNAKLLALARPSSLQSTGGFPTKLGEYLSTGKPTVITSVGDIPLYIKDNIHAFLVEPDDNFAFAEKIKNVLNNYEEALKVACNGKTLVYDVFNYKAQAERIHNFLTDVYF